MLHFKRMFYFSAEDVKLARNLPEITYEKDTPNPGLDIYSKQFCMIKLNPNHEQEDIVWVSNQIPDRVSI